MNEQIIAMRQAGRGYTDISNETGTSINSIKSICSRKKIKPITYEKCLECGKPLEQKEKRKRKKFCCKRCKDIWWNHNRRWAVHG